VYVVRVRVRVVGVLRFVYVSVFVLSGFGAH
jgi:hypothetical protein